MPVSERAKQFSPFQSLKGLGEALRKKEIELLQEERRELSEEQSEQLNRKLLSLSDGTYVTVHYYAESMYHSVSGTIADLNRKNRVLDIAGIHISFDDITEIV